MTSVQTLKGTARFYIRHISGTKAIQSALHNVLKTLKDILGLCFPTWLRPSNVIGKEKHSFLSLL